MMFLYLGISQSAIYLPEVLGQSALFNSPNDIDGFANNMQKVYNETSLRKQLVDKGLENIKGFSWEKSTRDLSNIINFH